MFCFEVLIIVNLYRSISARRVRFSFFVFNSVDVLDVPSVRSVLFSEQVSDIFTVFRLLFSIGVFFPRDRFRPPISVHFRRQQNVNRKPHRNNRSGNAHSRRYYKRTLRICVPTRWYIARGEQTSIEKFTRADYTPTTHLISIVQKQ